LLYFPRPFLICVCFVFQIYFDVLEDGLLILDHKPDDKNDTEKESNEKTHDEEVYPSLSGGVADEAAGGDARAEKMEGGEERVKTEQGVGEGEGGEDEGRESDAEDETIDLISILNSLKEVWQIFFFSECSK
jgi:hypothetical protein